MGGIVLFFVSRAEWHFNQLWKVCGMSFARTGYNTIPQRLLVQGAIPMLFLEVVELSVESEPCV